MGQFFPLFIGILRGFDPISPKNTQPSTVASKKPEWTKDYYPKTLFFEFLQQSFSMFSWVYSVFTAKTVISLL
ncbi:hypothetical protein [Flagellimonas sp. S3867]|uniref:hypothetical protein n=1 Tax=Flagellimonas sp. S3867 TaxID=2768063 RepID=UPI001CC26801|nr:hypothetical protein [Flagellimonas sp. S3867]